MTKITHELIYTNDMVCKECGSSEWHVNILYNNRNGGIFYGEINPGGWETGEDTWCHNCGGWRDLVNTEKKKSASIKQADGKNKRD